MINNFIEKGIVAEDINILCSYTGEVPQVWKEIAEKNKPVNFFFYKDGRANTSYIPSVYFNLMKQHLLAHPELEKEVLFLHDCDILFTKSVDFSEMEKDDVWYLSDTIGYIGTQYILSKGEEVYLKTPYGDELPNKGFDVEDAGFQAPAEDGSSVVVAVSETSDRLQLLAPFEAWDGKNISGAKLLIKAFGKCTTDHISMAGPWLRFRGHLDNISNNMLIGAENAFNSKANSVKNQLTGTYDAVPAVQRAYKAAGVPSIVVGDHNYGEGSSREHAAMEPRFLGVKAVLVKSFARIHETNLKKQGMLALTFANEADYDKIQENDTINFLDLTEFAPGKPLTLEFVHADGSKDIILANHTYNESQIGWFVAGSALNLIAANA
jgi:hypothetical protein